MDRNIQKTALVLEQDPNLVRHWERFADSLGVSSAEQSQLETLFNNRSITTYGLIKELLSNWVYRNHESSAALLYKLKVILADNNFNYVISQIEDWTEDEEYLNIDDAHVNNAQVLNHQADCEEGRPILGNSNAERRFVVVQTQRECVLCAGNIIQLTVLLISIVLVFFLYTRCQQSESSQYKSLPNCTGININDVTEYLKRGDLYLATYCWVECLQGSTSSSFSDIGSIVSSVYTAQEESVNNLNLFFNTSQVNTTMQGYGFLKLAEALNKHGDIESTNIISLAYFIQYNLRGNSGKQEYLYHKQALEMIPERVQVLTSFQYITLRNCRSADDRKSYWNYGLLTVYPETLKDPPLTNAVLLSNATNFKLPSAVFWKLIPADKFGRSYSILNKQFPTMSLYATHEYRKHLPEKRYLAIGNLNKAYTWSFKMVHPDRMYFCIVNVEDYWIYGAHPANDKDYMHAAFLWMKPVGPAKYYIDNKWVPSFRVNEVGDCK